MTIRQPGNRIWAVVPAAGAGSRMGLDLPKQYIQLDGKTIIEHSLSSLLAHSWVEGAVVAISAEDDHWQRLSLHQSFDKPIITVEGGRERCHSVLNGIVRVQQEISDQDWVLVHDAARPCLRLSDLDKLIRELQGQEPGGILATRVRDTMKRADNEGNIMQTVDRTNLWHALTPQMFRLGVLKSAIELALDKSMLVTDEASAIEAQGLKPRLVEGHNDNIKVTTKGDLALAEYYLKLQAEAKAG